MDSILSAIRYGDEDTLSIQLAYGADPDETDDTGNTPLHYVMDVPGDINLLEILLRHGPNINAVNMHGETPLHIAVASGNLDGIELLLSYSEEMDKPLYINEIDNYGFTPILYAASNGYVDIFTLLIDADADYTRLNVHNYSDPEIKRILTLLKTRLSNIVLNTIIRNGGDLTIQPAEFIEYKY